MYRLLCIRTGVKYYPTKVTHTISLLYHSKILFVSQSRWDPRGAAQSGSCVIFHKSMKLFCVENWKLNHWQSCRRMHNRDKTVIDDHLFVAYYWFSKSSTIAQYVILGTIIPRFFGLLTELIYADLRLLNMNLVW